MEQLGTILHGPAFYSPPSSNGALYFSCMPSLKLYTSNKLEMLLDALCAIVRTPHDNPLTSEIVVVQNKGMERWISLQLAKALGIWSHCSYFFPNSFVEHLFKQAFADLPLRWAFEPQTLMWRIMEMLPRCLDRPEFGPLKRYASGKGQRRLYQLSACIADTFDQYTLYRPSLVLQWEQGADAHWQAVLWRELTRGGDAPHRARLRQRMIERIADGSYQWPAAALRISLFGITSLPPFHVELIRALSTVIDVHLFLLNPCAEYWDDVLSQREIGRLSGKRGGKPDRQRTMDLHWDPGNSLLASLGAYGREFLTQLHDLDG